MGGSAHEDAERITCVLVDDHPSVVAALEELLEAEGISVIARASTGKDALGLVDAGSTVVVSDLRLPDMSGLDLAAALLRVDPACRIVIYSGTISPQGAATAFDLGVRAVVLKGSLPTELSGAIRIVAAGGTHLDPRIAG